MLEILSPAALADVSIPNLPEGELLPEQGAAHLSGNVQVPGDQ